MKHWKHFPRRWEGQPWLLVELGYWYEMKRWPRPGSIFKWRGYLRDCWYFVKCALWRRYDRVVVETLSPEWNEYDTRLLHASFQILGDYMRCEERWTVASIDDVLAGTSDDSGWFTNYRPTAVELEVLQQWWTTDRAIERKEEDDALTAWHDAFDTSGGFTSTPTGHGTHQLSHTRSAEEERLRDVHTALEVRNDAKDEEMLIRLMKVRLYLWN